MRRAFVRAFAAVSILVLLAAACGDDGDGGGEADPGQETTVPDGSTTSSAPDDGEPQSGGELTFMYASETRSMDPAIGGGSALSGEPPRLFAVYDALVYADNTTNEIVMGTAESFESTDNTVWTLTLKPDITFTDGTAYDAEAVKAEWERRKDPALASPSLGILNGITSIEVVDPLTLEITLAQPNGQFPRNVSASLAYIPSPTAVAAAGADFGTQPVGAGPFMLEEWVRDSHMTLVRNPDYWNAPLPYLDEVTVRVLADDSQRIQSILNGEADGTQTNLPDVQARAEEEGLTLQRPAAIGSTGIAYDTSKPPFDDVRIRQAIQVGIDPEQLNEIGFAGLATPATGWFPEDSVFFDESVRLPEFDPAEAQRLFDEYTAENGDVELPFDNLSDVGQNPRIAEFITGTLSSYDGVNATFTLQPQAGLTQNIRDRNFHASGYAYLGADPEPNFAESFRTGGTRNFWGISDPDLDAALLEARDTLDVDVRREAYIEAQEILNEYLPMYLFPRNTSAFAYRDGVMGTTELHDDGGPIFHLIWLSE